MMVDGDYSEADFQGAIDFFRRGGCDVDVLDDLVEGRDEFTVKHVVKTRQLVDEGKLGQEFAQNKLFALYELNQEPEEVKLQVKTWISEDPKRQTLYTYSTQADVYMELLVAKATGNLDEYRRRYNPNAKAQRPWTYPRVFEEVVPENPKRAPIEDKINAVQKVALEEIMREKQAVASKVKPFFEESAKFIEGWRKRGSPIIGVDDWNAFFKDNLGVFDNAEWNAFLKSTELLRDVETDDFIGGAYSGNSDGSLNDLIEQKYVGESGFLQRENLKLIQNRLLDLEISTNDYTAEAFLKSLHKATLGVFDDTLEHMEKQFQDLRTSQKIPSIRGYEYVEVLSPNTVREIETLHLMDEDDPSRKPLEPSSKLKTGKTVKYAFKLSDKDPLDVRFGNDSGCCIGVYPSENDIGNADGLPHMLADNAVLFFDLDQKIGEGKPHRTGIVLAFDGINDGGRPVLACNSLELSPHMNLAAHLEGLVSFVEEAVVDYSQTRGYASAFMSAHDYNTSQNYSKSARKKYRPSFRKTRGQQERPFYNELLGPRGDIRAAHGCYRLQRDQIQPQQEAHKRRDKT